MELGGEGGMLLQAMAGHGRESGTGRVRHAGMGGRCVSVSAVDDPALCHDPALPWPLPYPSVQARCRAGKFLQLALPGIDLAELNQKLFYIPMSCCSLPFSSMHSSSVGSRRDLSKSMKKLCDCPDPP